MLKKHKLLFPYLNHVSCLAHSINVVCQEIMQLFPKANSLITEMKRVLIKAPSRKKAWKAKTKLPLPPVAVVTRWGSWLTTAIFYAKNIDTVISFIKSFESTTESAALERLKNQDADCLRMELDKLLVFAPLPLLIKQLETNGLEMQEQMKILKRVTDIVKVSAKSRLENKLKSSLEKNPHLLNFTANQYNPGHFASRKYSPLTSVHVERSFSQYKSMLRDNRKSMTQETIKAQMILQYNSFM